MTWRVEEPVCRDGITFVPIVDVDIAMNGSRLYFSGHGRKRPLLFILLRNQEITGIDLSGRVYDAEEIERQFPDAVQHAIALRP